MPPKKKQTGDGNRLNGKLLETALKYYTNQKKPQEGSGLYQTIANRVFGSDLGENEYHAPQFTKNGFTFGSYVGPGTDVYNNIRKGKQPVSETDKISLKHDLAYGRARNAADVRAADLKMVNKIKEVQKNKGDYKFNTYMGRLPIQGKMLLENLGIMKPGSFADFDPVPEADRKVSDDKFNELEQQGYGKKKSAWLTHVAATKKKNPKVSYKEVLKLASRSYKVK